jgi:glycosyltransferase involved in cell wall biosynthesis
MFGTERMALATLDGLGAPQCMILAPPGSIEKEAAARGHLVLPAPNHFQLLREIEGLLRKHRELVFLTTTVPQAFAVHAMSLLYRRRVSHLHVVHGGSDEFSSYGRKKLLNHLNVSLVAVSEFVREKLIAHGVRPQKIHTIGNFLSEKTAETIHQRKQEGRSFKGRGLLVSRLVHHKRIELLFDAIGLNPTLREYQFDVFGSGDLAHHLKSRAQQEALPIKFCGYVSDAASRFANYDFLVHLNSEEPFGLVVLEAMAPGIPVLVPDQGGAATIVRDRENGFHFRSEDANDLAAKLLELRHLNPSDLKTITDNAQKDLNSTFSSKVRISAYRQLISDSLS